jgi:RES domain-containing protein
MPRYVAHSHTPIFRVVRAGWPDPLDASFSQKARDNRWNDDSFPALYCCCSEAVARGVTVDILRFAGVEASDLVPSVRPRLIEIAWSGRVVDVASAEGVAEAGFDAHYPENSDKVATRRQAAAWTQRKPRAWSVAARPCTGWAWTHGSATTPAGANWRSSCATSRRHPA